MTSTTQPVYETVSWQSQANVSDQQMLDAMSQLSHDIRQLPGFIEQTLYQRPNQEWLAVYYWETEKHAHDSNTLIADKDSFHHLMSLIQADSVAIEVLSPLQQTAL